MKPTLKPPGTKRLKLKYVKFLSSFAFRFKLRRYNQDGTARLLKFRAGHSAPPTHVTFYGRDSWILLQV